MKKTKTSKGITLVALIVTIVILLILAVIAVNTIQNDGILVRAQKATFKSKISQYKEELDLYIYDKRLESLFMGFDVNNLSADKTTNPSITDIIKSMTEEDAEKFVIQAGKLIYIGEDEEEREWGTDTGITVSSKLKKLYGNSVQNGNPSPTNPVEIQSVGDKTINLLDFENMKTLSQNADGTYTLIPGSHNKKDNAVPIYLEAGKTYTWYAEIVSLQGTGASIRLYDVEGIAIKTSSLMSTGIYNFSVDVSGTYFALNGIQSTSSGGTIVKNLMIVEGTYTLNTIPSYEPYGYKIPVKVSGKNLLDFDNMKLMNTTDTNVRGGWEFEFKKDVDIAITHDASNELPIGILLAKKVTDGVYGSNIQLTNNVTTISLKANEKLLVFVGARNVDASYRLLANNGITKIQVEYGAATEYEPYVEPQTVNIYLDEPLRKIGDVEDYIDFENKQVIRNVGKVIYDENSDISNVTSSYWQSEGITKAFSVFVPNNVLTNVYGTECLCNIFKFDSASDGIDKTKLYISGNTSQWIFAVKNETASTIEELKTFLAENNMEVLYPLATPDPQPIELPTIIGTNITVETQVQPSKIEK